MRKFTIELLKAAKKFESLGQAPALEAADIQVALGQDEKAGTFRSANGRGYYSQDTINAIITDFCNRFNVSDDTKGNVNINYNNGAITFTVRLTGNNAQKSAGIAKYLQTKYSADMSRKVLAYLKSQGKASAGVLTVGWINF
jgi:hypothetical protein